MATKSSGAEQLSFVTDDVVFSQGRPADKVYIINSGHVQLTRRVFSEEFVVETLGPGNICGEVAVAAETVYPVTAVALDDLKLLAVSRENIDSVLMAKPEVAARMTARLAVRLTQAHFRLSNLSFRSVEGRVMLQLRYEAGRNDALSGASYVQIPYDLPDVLATERGAVDAALRSLIADSLVEVDGQGRFRIANLAAFDRKLKYRELADRFGD